MGKVYRQTDVRTDGQTDRRWTLVDPESIPKLTSHVS